MESSRKETTPCSSGASACNRDASVRPPPVVDPDSFTDDNWPRFLVIKSLDNKCITKHNLFVIAKAIEGIAGKPKDSKCMKNAGLLLIEVDRKHHAVNLLKANMLHDIPVQITPHRSMNSSKGVITCRDLYDMEDDDILNGLRSSNQNIKDVSRISSFKNGQRTKTSTFILTFSASKLPEKIYVGHSRLNVRTYIPNPRRCTNCQQFQHTKTFCRNDAICNKCGEPGHEEKECKKGSICVNCKGPHKSSSRDCPVWKTEKAIVEYKYNNDVSFQAARKKVEEQSNASINSTTVTYSAAVSGPMPMSEAETQTDLTWPNFLTSPILYSQCITTNEQSTQSTEMDSESANIKRTRTDSSSSNDENGSSRSSKRRDLSKSRRSKSEVRVNSSRAGKDTTPRFDHPISGGIPRVGDTSSREVKGDGGRQSRPPERSALPPPRSGRNKPSKSRSEKSRSPVKPPH